MRELLRILGINGLAIYFTSLLLPGLVIRSNFETYLIAAVVYTVLVALLSASLVMVITPLNLLTLGFASSVLTIISLFVMSKIHIGVAISSFSFPGFTVFGLAIKPFYASNILSYLLISVIIFTIARLMKWLSGE